MLCFSSQLNNEYYSCNRSSVNLSVAIVHWIVSYYMSTLLLFLEIQVKISTSTDISPPSLTPTKGN